jgi:predicted dehydrogenase
MTFNKTVGIIGAGEIVFAAHLPFLKAMGARPKWIVDIAGQSAKNAASAYDIPVALTPDELEKTTPTDIILLACPYGARKPYYDFFRKNEAALYIEKPVAKSMAEQYEISSLREDYAICAGFMRRSMGLTNIVKGLIEDEIFGRLHHVKSAFGTATQTSAGAGFAKNLDLAGGGQLFESAVHNIDAICYMANLSRPEVLKKKHDSRKGFRPAHRGDHRAARRQKPAG